MQNKLDLPFNDHSVKFDKFHQIEVWKLLNIFNSIYFSCISMIDLLHSSLATQFLASPQKACCLWWVMI